MFVVAIDSCPSHAWTVTGSTPLASQRHAGRTGCAVVRDQVRSPAARRDAFVVRTWPDPTANAHLVSIPATGSVSCETPHYARHDTCDPWRLRLCSRWIHPWRTPIQRRPGTRLGSVLGPCSLRTLWRPRRRCSDRHTALPQVIAAAPRLSRVTSEPPTRCSRICTLAPGRKGAARRCAMASGHPCPQTPTSRGLATGSMVLPTVSTDVRSWTAWHAKAKADGLYEATDRPPAAPADPAWRPAFLETCVLSGGDSHRHPSENRRTRCVPPSVLERRPRRASPQPRRDPRSASGRSRPPNPGHGRGFPGSDGPTALTMSRSRPSATSLDWIDKTSNWRMTPCHTYDASTMSASPSRTSTR